jgi:4,5-DOPA dioxygenase extradiol
MVMLTKTPAHDFLAGYGRELGKPKAILIATAHFETRRPVLTADEKPEMIYDFGGFPRPLYEMQYPAPGMPDLAVRAARMLGEQGIPAVPVVGRGYDHGTWVPLKLMYPDADVPVVQLSIQPGAGAAHHIAMGRALAPLREEGVLVVGSGSMTHNLRELARGGREMEAPTPDWVSEFGNWMHERIEAGAIDDVAAWETRAPHAQRNHPSDDHFLPLPFAMGAAGKDARGRRVHTSCEYGVLMMDCYAWG